MIALWCLGAALAGPAPGADDAAPDFDSYLDRARFYLGKEKFADAQTQLELAARTPMGSEDAETWFMLAKVLYERGQLAQAEEAAAQARLHSRNPSEFSQTQELYGFFRNRFGTLILDGPRGARTLVALEPKSTELDPELKAYVAKWRSRISKDEVVLPFSLGVPVGEYQVNGRAATIAPGETTVVTGAIVPRSGFGAATIAVAGGGLGWRVSGLRTSGFGELSVLVPWRGWVGGIVGQVVAQRVGEGATITTAMGGSAGIRVGRRMLLGHPWVLVPALNLRGGRVPGIDGGFGERAAAIGLFGGAELRASYERSAHWAIGFTLAGEGFAGMLPARAGSADEFSAWSWRLQTSIGYRL